MIIKTVLICHLTRSPPQRGEIFTVSASDSDTGDNAVITYTVQDTTRYTVLDTGAITLNVSYLELTPALLT